VTKNNDCRENPYEEDEMANETQKSKIYAWPVIVTVLFIVGAILPFVGLLWIGIGLLILAWVISLFLASDFFPRVREFLRTIIRGYP
jgi:hypothetical protein